MSIPHSRNFLTIDDAHAWFLTQSHASESLLKYIKIAVRDNDSSFDTQYIPQNLWHMSLSEVLVELGSDEVELNIISSFMIIASAEGRLKYDFELKLSSSSKSPLVIEFKAIHKRVESMKDVSVETDILENWKKYHSSPDMSAAVGNFKTLLKFRHWVAHGRFWKPNNLGRAVERMQPDLVKTEVEGLFNLLASLPDGFIWK